MLKGENMQVYVIFKYIRDLYHYMDLIARCHTANDVYGEILSHSLSGEMFT